MERHTQDAENKDSKFWIHE